VLGRRGILYLIPTGLGGGDAASVLAPATLSVLPRLADFIVENAKSARRFLKAAGHPGPLQGLRFRILDEHTANEQLPEFLVPLVAGRDIGLLSEAGCPAVADPGAELIRLAHAAGIRVVPLVGPSAILLALMASGLNGQRFAFHGYLPVDIQKRRERLAVLERDSLAKDRTQIFIEAPYRNQALFQAVLETCRGDTLLCLATDLLQPSETVCTRPIAEWKVNPAHLNRRPTVFLLYTGARRRAPFPPAVRART
jgi:16S rRNA (cytidine1402-2'-O)-methyltransferase